MVTALTPAVRVRLFKSVPPLTPAANLALPELSVVTVLVIVYPLPVKDTSTLELPKKPVMVKLRMAFLGSRAKPLE